MGNEYEGYLIAPAKGKGMMREIKPIGKGSVVKELKGLYTSEGAAQKAIDTYLRSNKGKRNGKTKSTT